MRYAVSNLQCKYDPIHQKLFLTTAQLKIRFSVPADEAMKAALLSEMIERKEKTPEVSELLEKIRHLPISLFTSRGRNEIDGDEVRADVKTWASPKQFLIEIGYEEANNSGFTFDQDFITANCRIESESDLYDPLAAHALIVDAWRTSPHLIDLNFSELDEVLASDEPQFFRIIAQILEQTHYVTSQCLESLQPSLSLVGRLGTFMREFAKDEKGHHILLAHSLSEIRRAGPIETDVQDSTVGLMEVLKYAAANNPLALSVLLTFFEGVHLDRSDPLAVLLSRSSRPRSAIGIQKHWDINRNGQHGLAGEEFARLLGPVSGSQVLQASQLLETAANLKKQISDEIMTSVDL